MRIATVAALAAMTGCAAPEEAPTDIATLSAFFFSSFGADEALLGDALSNLDLAIAASADLDADRPERQWEIPVLGPESTAEVAVPEGEDPNEQLAIAIARRSVHAVPDHLPAILALDQAPGDPTAPTSTRALVAGGDCFDGRGCDQLDVLNDITKRNALLEVTYQAPKQYRHVTLPDGRAAIAARTWNEQVWEGEQGQNSIDQTFQVDVIFEDAADPSRAIRYFCLWSAVTLSIDASEDLMRGTMALGSDNFLRAQDEWLTAGVE